MSEQLALEFAELHRDPFTCEHVLRITDFKPAKVVCIKTGSEVYTNCQQVRRCVYEPIDNSPAARARRVREMGVIND